MNLNVASSTSFGERYREVVLKAHSAGELHRELARHGAGRWQLLGVFSTCSRKGDGMQVTLILEQVQMFAGNADELEAQTAVS